MLQRLLAIVRKELITMLRDPRARLALIIPPSSSCSSFRPPPPWR